MSRKLGRQLAGPLRRLRAKLNAAQKRRRMLLPKRPGRAPGKSKIKRKRRHLHRPSRSPNRGVRSKGHISVLLYSPIKCETARLEAARKQDGRAHQRKRAMYSDPNHPERQQKEPHKWIKHQRDERHRPAKHKQHTPEEESYHRSSRALSDIKYVCLRARVPAIYAAKCFLRNSSVRAFASCQTGPSKPWPAPG